MLIIEPEISICEIIRFTFETEFDVSVVKDMNKLNEIDDISILLCDYDIYLKHQKVIDSYIVSFEEKPGFILLSLYNIRKEECDISLIDYLLVKPFELDELILDVKELQYFKDGIKNYNTFSAYIPARYYYLKKIRNIILRSIDDICSNKVNSSSCRLIFEELADNTISHAYPDKFGYIELSFSISSDHSFSIEIKDSGKGFNVDDLDESIKEYENNILRTRGRGLLLVRELSDDLLIESNPESGTNIKACINLLT